MSILNSNDTICAIATATGGAIGIVRLSGANTFSIIRSVANRVTENTPHRKAILTPITDKDGVTLDEAIVTLYPAPHSYTGDDCAEISCHGSRYILDSVVRQLISHGARLARPGEFTQRAFLNGKMDLSQAEAVADLIASTNRASQQMAMSQLKGHFSSELSLLRDQLLHLTSLLELELDFSDHEELEFADRGKLLSLAEEIDRRITTLAQSFETGQALKQGIPIAIVGRTNVGKSTLLNRLLKDERAIVSDIHGTTRDAIEDTVDIQGVTFRIIDTAGIRQTTDTIEQIGIQKTYDAIAKARIILWLFDEQPNDAEIADIVRRAEGKELIPVHNKSDLAPSDCESIAGRTVISISAKHEPTLDSLEQRVYQAAGVPDIHEGDIIVTNARHYEALLRAHDALTRVIDGLTAQLPTDLIAEDLRLTLDALADITGGAITPQETLNNIFRHFCVGK